MDPGGERRQLWRARTAPHFLLGIVQTYGPGAHDDALVVIR
jgi:hypothetical protein